MTQPTFNWLGDGRRQGERTYYSSFLFCDALYRLGDSVALLPEEPGTPPFLAKILRAFEDDTVDAPSERLCIEVGGAEDLVEVFSASCRGAANTAAVHRPTSERQHTCGRNNTFQLPPLLDSASNSLKHGICALEPPLPIEKRRPLLLTPFFASLTPLQVSWYDRRAQLPYNIAVNMDEHEVVELTDQTDVNQVGCIAGRAAVIRAASRQEAEGQLEFVLRAANQPEEWFFCRGVFDSGRHSFREYTEQELMGHGWAAGAQQGMFEIHMFEI